jgi:hypothetical protein
MWIDRAVYVTLNGLVESAQNRNTEMLGRTVRLETENAALKAELARHIADKDWFKHRLNQVEMERAQLIYAATGGSGGGRYAAAEGVKVMAPQFVTAGAPKMSETLNEQHNPFGTVGEDSRDPEDQIPGTTEMLSHMPGFPG